MIRSLHRSVQYSKQYIIGYGTKEVEKESFSAISSRRLFNIFTTGFNKIHCDKPILHKSKDAWILYISPVVITDLGFLIPHIGPYEHRDLSKSFLDIDYFKLDHIAQLEDYGFYICETSKPEVNGNNTHACICICTCNGICNGTCNKRGS